MAGGFVHLTVVAFARGRLAEVEGLTLDDKRRLSQFETFMDVGAVGPDYPYLGGQSEWADKMHYRSTGEAIRNGVRALRRLGKDMPIRSLAWLLGYGAHVATDLTIHPIVERKVGVYAEHKTEHRTCEMHQDAYIWPRRNLGEIGLADYFRDTITPCSTDDGSLHPDVVRIWEEMLQATYPEDFKVDVPDFSKWNRGFKRIVDTVDDLGSLVPITRHVLASKGAAYPKSDEVNREFIDGLDTPEGKMGYDAVFDRAVSSVVGIWTVLGRALHAPTGEELETSLSSIPDGNLDTGRHLAEPEKFIYWNVT